MKRTSRIMSTVLALIMVFGLSACAAPGGGGGGGAAAAPPAPAAGGGAAAPADEAASADPVIIRLGHVLAATSFFEIGAQDFSRRAYEISGGEVIVETFPGGVLGGERDLFESLIMGTQDMMIISTASAGPFLPMIQVFDMPWLFRDRHHARDVVDGPIGEEVMGMLEGLGVKSLGVWCNGFRHVYSNFPVRSPEDVAGRRIRTMGAPIHVAMFEAMGAMATPMPFAELFIALQQGTVDGAENSVKVVDTDGLDEVATHLSFNGHVWNATPLLISMATWESLSPRHQEFILQAAYETKMYLRDAVIELEEISRNNLIERGMILIPEEEMDFEAFRAATLSVYDDFADEIPPELVERIRAY